jgi:hypothetical protein
MAAVTCRLKHGPACHCYTVHCDPYLHNTVKRSGDLHAMHAPSSWDGRG